MKRQILSLAFAALALCGHAADKKIAVFVQNKSGIPALDTQLGNVRERIVAAFAEVDGFQVVDSTLAADAFLESPNIAKAVGCDYAAVATILRAGATKRNLNGRLNTVFSLRMAFKVTDANGVSVDGMPTWTEKFPVLDADSDPTEYYDTLLDRWEADMTVAVATKAAKWREPAATDAALVKFHVQTSVDRTISELESQTKGVSGEQLQELRKVVGGASVELDGVVVGSAPGEFATTKGLHKLRVTRPWMDPYEATVSIQDGTSLDLALEMSDEGVRKWGTVEALRADLARRYAAAAAERNVKVNIDTSGWRDVGGNAPTIKVERQ